jgi:hypothetical protein
LLCVVEVAQFVAAGILELNLIIDDMRGQRDKACLALHVRHWEALLTIMGWLQSQLPLHLLHDEDLVLVELLVHRQLARLSESLGATLVWAPEWLLPCVDVGVFFQVLPESKLFKTYHTHKLLCWLMGSQVSS